MNKSKSNNMINEISDNNNKNISLSPNGNNEYNEEAINIMFDSSTILSEKQATKLFEENSRKYFDTNEKENIKFRKIYKQNMSFTKKEKQEFYWAELKSIFNSIDKTYQKYPYPKLPFGKSLDDLNFLNLVGQTINYAGYSQTNELLSYMKRTLKNIEKYTKNIFIYPNILKDLKKDSILSFIMGETKKEKEANLDLLKIEICTISPLIKFQIKRGNINYDLDKQELKDILGSKVLLSFYQDNLRNFIDNFDEKIKNENHLKEKIESYIDNYNIYFCDLPSYTMAVTIFTGDIYLRSVYLKEYYENITKDVINENNSIIIREKIVLNIKHEMNHVLLRLIDNEKGENFFLKSSNSKSKDNLLIFKDKFIKNKVHKLSKDESGNCFDYEFFMGYQFDNLFIKEANFFFRGQRNGKPKKL